MALEKGYARRDTEEGRGGEGRGGEGRGEEGLGLREGGGETNNTVSDIIVPYILCCSTGAAHCRHG